MEITHQFRWTTKLEKILASEGEKCHGYSWLHNRAAERYSKYNSVITLPTIVLATLSGTGTISQSYLFGNNLASSLIIGLMSIGAGVMNTVNSYYAWAKRSESHRIASINYSKIFRFVSVEMSLPRESRMLPKDFVKIVREEIDRLGEVSPMIPQAIRDEFKNTFEHEDSNISRPEICNGLERIQIYTRDDELNSINDNAPSTPLATETITMSPTYFTSNVYKTKKDNISVESTI